MCYKINFSKRAFIFTLVFAFIQVFFIKSNNIENISETNIEKQTIEDAKDTNETAIEIYNQQKTTPEKKYKSDYDLIISLLSDHDSIIKNDGFLKTGITGKKLLREITFTIIGLTIGTLVYLPTALVNWQDKINLKEWPYPQFIPYFITPFIISYLGISYGYKNYQKSKINLRILKRFLKNWKFLKDKIPNEIKKVIKPLRTEYKKHEFNINLQEKEAHKIITDIFKICINKQNDLSHLDLKNLLLKIVKLHPEVLGMLKQE